MERRVAVVFTDSVIDVEIVITKFNLGLMCTLEGITYIIVLIWIQVITSSLVLIVVVTRRGRHSMTGKAFSPLDTLSSLWVLRWIKSEFDWCHMGKVVLQFLRLRHPF
jgi:hypothetical protein